MVGSIDGTGVGLAVYGAGTELGQLLLHWKFFALFVLIRKSSPNVESAHEPKQLTSQSLPEPHWIPAPRHPHVPPVLQLIIHISPSRHIILPYKHDWQLLYY